MEFEAKVRRDIKPVMFPCQECDGLHLHLLFEQPTGLGFVIPFTRKALASTGRGFLLVCTECDQVSAQLDPHDVAQLANNMIPRTMYTAYPVLQDVYTPGFMKRLQERTGKKFESEGDQQIAELIKNYRLEV
jgi:hypothetical protein